MLGRDTQVIEFARLDSNVLAFPILVSFDDLVFLDDGCLVAIDRALEHFLMTHALPGDAADLVEVHAALAFGGNEEVDTERDERNLDGTGPIRTCRRSLLSSKLDSRKCGEDGY